MTVQCQYAPPYNNSNIISGQTLGQSISAFRGVMKGRYFKDINHEQNEVSKYAR